MRKWCATLALLLWLVLASAVFAQTRDLKVKTSTRTFVGGPLNIASGQLTIGGYSPLTTNSSLANLAIRNFADLQNKPTTVAGYGITDAVSLTGTHTLTNKSLTSPIITNATPGTMLKVNGSGVVVSATPGTDFFTVAAGALKADLGGDGKVLAAQLPAFVDVILEYANLAAFPGTGETGKIYLALDTNKQYRWSGTTYVEISASLALGATSASAHRGDHGAAAYTHSQLTSGNPHSVTKSDVGLGSVDNTSDANKPISTATQAVLDVKQTLNANLTAISALPTTSYGRAALALADAAAFRAYIGATFDQISGQIPIAQSLDYALNPATSASVTMYSGISHTGSGSYTRSSSWLIGTGAAEQVDLTPIAVYVSNNTHAAAVLVSPQHIVSANIGTPPAVGATVRFVTAASGVVERTISAVSDVTSNGAHIRVARLNSDVPGTISFAKVFSGTAQSQAQTGRDVLYIEQSTQKIYLGQMQPHASAYLGSVQKSVYAGRARLYGQVGWPSTSDVGSPYFFFLDGELVLLGPLHEDRNIFSFVGAQSAAVNAAMTSLGGGYQLTEYSKTLLTPVPPKRDVHLAMPVGAELRDSTDALAASISARTLNNTEGTAVLSWGDDTDRVTFAVEPYYENQRLATAEEIPQGVVYASDNLGDIPDPATALANLGGAPLNITENAQTGTAYTLVLGDAGKLVSMTNASANTLTVPTNATVAFATGTRIFVVMGGAGATTISPTSGVTIQSRGNVSELAGQHAVATLIKRGTNTWLLAGDLQ